MKVYITSDMEGISGVVHPEHTGWDGRRHHEARKWMTEHINAAVEAAVQMGATEVLVCDGHSNGRNVILDILHPAATLMWGRQNRRLGQVEGLDESFAALVMVGYHARAGSFGVLNHTMNSAVVAEMKVNGVPYGEIDMNAFIAGQLGVPVIMVSGDSSACAEAQERLPQIETAVTQVSIGTYSTKALPPVRAHAVIREATERAFNRLEEMVPWRVEPPYRLEMRFKDTAMAEVCAMVPGFDQVDTLTVGFTTNNYEEVFRAHMVMITLAATQRWENTA